MIMFKSLNNYIQSRADARAERKKREEFRQFRKKILANYLCTRTVLRHYPFETQEEKARIQKINEGFRLISDNLKDEDKKILVTE